MKILDKVVIIDNETGHPFYEGEVVTIFRIFPNNTYDVCNTRGDCWRVRSSEIKLSNPMKQLTEIVVNTAKRLCKSQNKVTEVDIKNEVMKTHSHYHWTVATVSAIMKDACSSKLFTSVEENKENTYCIYSEETKKKTMKTTKKSSVKVATKKATITKKTASPTTKTISRSKALELMSNNRGHFFTATFIDKKNKERTINCQYLKDQSYSKLGYVKVKEAIKAKVNPDDCIRNVNLQTLKSLKIGGNFYKVR